MKIYKKNENKFKKYRHIDVEDMEKFIIEKLGKLQTHQKLKKVCMIFCGIFMLYRCIFLLCGMKSQYILGLRTDMLIQKMWMMNSLTYLIFNLLHEVALFWNYCIVTQKLIVQHLPTEEKVSKTKFNWLRSEYVIDTLTSVDF